MAVWTREVINILKRNNINIHLATGYVDDLRFVLSKIRAGTRWHDGKMKWQQE